MAKSRFQEAGKLGARRSVSRRHRRHCCHLFRTTREPIATVPTLSDRAACSLAGAGDPWPFAISTRYSRPSRNTVPFPIARRGESKRVPLRGGCDFLRHVICADGGFQSLSYALVRTSLEILPPLPSLSTPPVEKSDDIDGGEGKGGVRTQLRQLFLCVERLRRLVSSSFPCLRALFASSFSTRGIKTSASTAYQTRVRPETRSIECSAPIIGPDVGGKINRYRNHCLVAHVEFCTSDACQT